ncbi:MAG: cystathionine beta-lyase [Brevundimonas sp.]
MTDRSDRTRLIAGATRRASAPTSGRRPVSPPVERASTLLNDSPAAMRDGSTGPTYGIEDLSAGRALREALAELEGASDVWLVPSGLAAVTVPLTALLQPGDGVVTTDALYGPTRRFLHRHLKPRGVETVFHPADASTDAILSNLTEQTRVLLIESPGSLTFDMADVPALTAACRERGVLTIMDNTWGAGLAFKPLAHGVDVSVQALTKYAGGHSDLLMGSIAVTDEAVAKPIFETIEDYGWRVTSDDAWLALRGLRTLPLRYAEQARSTRIVTDWLLARPEVADVLWPALPQSPAHTLWSRDYTGAASLFGLVMNGGDTASAHALMSALELFGLGYSWGGFESLITHETAQLRMRGAPPKLAGELLRVHVGLEDPKDLIADLEVGLVAWER